MRLTWDEKRLGEMVWYDELNWHGPPLGTYAKPGVTTFRGKIIPAWLCAQYLFCRFDEPIDGKPMGWKCVKHDACLLTSCPDMLSWRATTTQPKVALFSIG